MESLSTFPIGELRRVVFDSLKRDYPGVYTYKGNAGELIYNNLLLVVPDNRKDNLVLPFQYKRYTINLKVLFHD